MPGVDFQRVREMIKMSDVLKQLAFAPIEERGNQQRGACPVHKSSSSNSRSFSVNLGEGRYLCHKCGSHGNQLELWAAVNQMSIFEAAIDLCTKFGQEVPWISRW